MKKKISKIWGVGLTFVLAMSLLLVAAPGTVSAADPVINEWDEFAYPDEGEDGDWFRDAGIDAVGPIAQAIDDTLYAYVDDPDNLFKSDDGGRTWEETDYADDLTGEGAIVDMVCSSLDADILYVTDGNYVYKTDDGGDEWICVADDSLEKELEGTCGITITGEPITSIDVGYIDEDPFVFIGTVGDVTTGAVAATDTITIPAGCALDVTLNIDGAAITLVSGDSATVIAGKIATAVTTSGTLTTATSAGAVVTFTARIAGTAANGALPMTDAAYSGGTVPAITMSGGVDAVTGVTAVAQVDTVTPVVASVQQYGLRIATGGVNYDFSYTTGAIATAAEISAAFTALVNAHATIPVTAADLTGTFTLTAGVAGTPFTATSTGTGVLTIVITTPNVVGVTAVTAVAATGTTTIPAAVDALDTSLNIDGAAITLISGDSAADIAGKIATAVTAGGTDTTATASVADVTFTARTAGAAGNGALPMTDAAYSGGTVPTITMTGGADGSLTVGSGSVYFLDEEAYGAEWIDMELACEYPGYYALSVGCAPDFEDSEETYVVISDGSETHVIYTDGGVCEWEPFAELLWDCETANHFGSAWASRIGFPDDWEDTETLFVGVVDVDSVVGDCGDGDGGDVYSVTEDEALDRNVVPGTGGCDGDATDIVSLDFCGDTDSGSVVAGALCDTTVYYSSDGGWEWDPSIKDPTGEGMTYVLWIGDCGESALAATLGCECALSLTCVSEEEDAEDVGMSWNQISLIATDISCVLDIHHSPGYITDSETLFMVTESDMSGTSCDTTSLFRYDGTDWDRVFCSTTYYDDFQGDEEISAVQVSPDFLDTETVFVTNAQMDIFRSQDAGCSWDRIGYPCDPTTLTSWAVLDEDTIYVGADGVVLLTDRHGGRPWDECVVEDADESTDAGYIRYFAFNGDSILVGDDEGQVFLCEVDPDEDWEDQEWHLVGDCNDIIDDDDTSVAFDPGYAVTDDAGENIIYAAAGNDIARCVIDPDEAWEDQDWDLINDDVSGSSDDVYWGIKVVGDTALYVGDTYDVGTNDGGVLRSLNPTEEDEEDVVFERVTEGLTSGTDLRGLRTLTAGEEGCPDSNVLWSIGDDEDCAEVWFYEDTLAFPVIPVSPTDGAEIGETDDVTLSWEAFCDAVCYEVELYRYCEECPDDKEYVDLYCDDDCDCDFSDNCIECEEDCVGCSDETCCLFVTGGWVEVEDVWEIWSDLEPGSTYYWRIRVCDPVLSKWSELWEFTTAMTAVDWWGLCSPECGGDDIIITPNFSWEDVSDATSYEVQLATNEDFDPVIASGTPTTNAWLGAPELDYGTTYYWRVRALKDGITSDWVTCIFTTMAEPAAEQFCCPDCGLCFDTEAELEAHWDAKHAPVAPTTPAYIWVIIAVGALLVVAVLILIVRTRRTV